MINKQSYGFNTFAANRIGEIHCHSDPEDWYWIEGKLNIADMTTRGCKVSELNEKSEWQNGPEFLKLDEKDWPIMKETNVSEIPELKKGFVAATIVKAQQASLADEFDINRFSKYKLLLYTTARIMKLFQRYKSGGNKQDVEIQPNDIRQAEELWIKKAQEGMENELLKGKYKRLQPCVKDEMIVVGGRTEA